MEQNFNMKIIYKFKHIAELNNNGKKYANFLCCTLLSGPFIQKKKKNKNRPTDLFAARNQFV